MKSKIIRILTILVILELVYLAGVNLALRLPVTQQLINQIKPEKFAISWDQAWSWYPFRIHAQGLSMNGQSSSQQWQVSVDDATASISLLPLLWRTVNVHGVNGVNVEYKQRPRIKPNKDYAKTRAFFPPIENRELGMAEVRLEGKKEKKPWTISLQDIDASGRHKFWLYQLQAVIEGNLHTDLSIETRGGPFSISNGKMNVQLESLLIDGEHEILRQARLDGSMEMAPIVFKENKGIKALAFVDLDLDIQAEMGNLEFLNLYLQSIQDMQVSGKGQLQGHVNFHQGELLSGTRIEVAADDLALDLLQHRIDGQGEIKLNVDEQTDELLHLSIGFDTVSAHHLADPRPLATGKGLTVSAQSSPSLFPPDTQAPRATYLALDIPSVAVPELAVYQRYIPEKWGFKLHGGNGELQARMVLTHDSLDTDLRIQSDNAEVGFQDYGFKTDLDLGIKLDSPSFKESSIDISGSYLKLDNSGLSSKQKQNANAAWQTSLSIDKGVLELNLPETIAGNPKKMARLLSEQDFKSLLETADAQLDLSGGISDLGWISLFLKNPYQLAVHGGGKLAAHLGLSGGWISEGSRMTITPEQLRVNVLEYEAQGAGKVNLTVEKGGGHPDLALALDLSKGQFKRTGEDKAFVEDLTLKLKARATAVSKDEPGKNVSLHLQILSAKVKDMSVYNSYLPPDSPLTLLGGTADLTADIKMQPEDADGQIKLETSNLRSRINDQELAAELTVDIKISDGVPKDMEFDISGSRLLLNKVRISGEQETFEQADWNALITLQQGRAIWKKPIQLQLDATLNMTDSRPVVAMLSNHRGKHGWLEKMLTIKDLQGELRMNIKNEQIRIPYAFAGSDKIDVGAKGVIDANNRQGLFYARFRKLKGLLKINNDDRNFDILGARKSFDSYMSGE